MALLRSLYEPLPGAPEQHLPYRRAGAAVIRWRPRPGRPNPTGGEAPGSPWWRAVNERLLRDTAESRAHLLGQGGRPSTTSVVLSVAFACRPSARAWYRAHNATIVAAYLDNRDLAEGESRV